MATDKLLLLRAIPASKKPIAASYTLLSTDRCLGIEVEVEGIGERRIRSYYFVQLYVNGQKVSKSTKSKPSSSVLKWKWDTDIQT